MQTIYGNEIAIQPNSITAIEKSEKQFDVSLFNDKIAVKVDNESTALYEWFKAKCKAQLTNSSPNEELLKKVQSSIPQMQEILEKFGKK